MKLKKPEWAQRKQPCLVSDCAEGRLRLKGRLHQYGSLPLALFSHSILNEPVYPASVMRSWPCHKFCTRSKAWRSSFFSCLCFNLLTEKIPVAAQVAFIYSCLTYSFRKYEGISKSSWQKWKHKVDLFQGKQFWNPCIWGVYKRHMEGRCGTSG